MFGYPPLSPKSKALVEKVNQNISWLSGSEIIECVENLSDENNRIHLRRCFNLDPASNIMNPRAEDLLCSGLGVRPSLGHPGEKYEMGLQAIEQIEVITTSLACEVFQAKYAEVRVPSGAMGNFYALLAHCEPGDTIIVPPAEIAGHVTLHAEGGAGLFRLNVLHAPISADGYTVDVAGLRQMAKEVQPKLICIGGSLNLIPHPVVETVSIAREVGAKVHFDAAHQCGLFAGGVWENPLNLGVDTMSMSTYKSLAGPPAGLVLTNSEEIAKRLDKIAFPGMTANFDAAKTAALAVTLIDWRDFGNAYADLMVMLAKELADALDRNGVKVFKTKEGATLSHQIAIEAAPYGGGKKAAEILREAGILSSGIGLPLEKIDDDYNGLRFGTPELARIGMRIDEMPRLAEIIAKAFKADDASDLAPLTASWRREFRKLHFMHDH